MARALAMLVRAAACATVFLTLGLLPDSSAPGDLATILSDEQARSVTPALIAATRSPDEIIAVKAVLALGRTERLSAETGLLAATHDRRAAVRALAIYGLGLLKSGLQQSAIARALLDANGAVRIAALDAADRYAAANLLTRLQSGDLARRVVSLLDRDPQSLVRARAAATLESFAGSPSASVALRALARAVRADRTPAVREFAMWSIYRGYAAKAGRTFVRSALHDRDEIVRIEGVRAVGKGGIAADAPDVRSLLHDPSWRVQEQASETLRLLHGVGLTAHWKAMPSFVHVPPMRPDPLASLPALPRTPATGAPHAPTVEDVLGDPALWHARLDPTTAAAMSGPAPGAHPRVRIVTTQGNIYITLFPEWAPFTVENFLALVNRGYYDHNRWFRIVPDFVVQTGDPHDNGNGDAGYSIRAEENPIAQDSYVLSMGLNYTNPPNAHAIRDSAGAQYYVTLSPQLHLDRDFTVFGRVTSGYWVLGRLTERDWVVRIERVRDQVVTLSSPARSSPDPD